MEVVNILNPFGTKGFSGARACLNMGSSRKTRGCEVRERGSGQVFSLCER